MSFTSFVLSLKIVINTNPTASRVWQTVMSLFYFAKTSLPAGRFATSWRYSAVLSPSKLIMELETEHSVRVRASTEIASFVLSLEIVVNTNHTSHIQGIGKGVFRFLLSVVFSLFFVFWLSVFGVFLSFSFLPLFVGFGFG